ncbi:uncharacterized protein LOC141646966 [Silene latifolia]|uniref:uncharacterized protein LOC141646966 n=1 Tax=Silene latifolia TaxID=37657 RepID=UPI003D771744
MGILRLLQSTFTFSKQLPKSQFNLTRTLRSVSTSTPSSISPEFVKFVTDSPRSSVIPLLEQYFAEKKFVLQSEVPKIIQNLHKLKFYDRALEVFFVFLLTREPEGDRLEVYYAWTQASQECSTRLLLVTLEQQHFEPAAAYIITQHVTQMILEMNGKRKLIESTKTKLTVLEWTNCKPVRHTDSSDLPLHLDLVGKVRGMEKALQLAVQCMEKALQLGPRHKGWAPKRAVMLKILSWACDNGDSDQVQEFLKLMGRVTPMKGYTYLKIKASSKHEEDMDINAILQRLEDDNIRYRQGDDSDE